MSDIVCDGCGRLMRSYRGRTTCALCKRMRERVRSRMGLSRLLCLHCGKRVQNNSRGLCRPCFEQPEVRKGYPTPRGRGHYVGSDFCGKGPVPKVPVPWRPGTALKLEAMAQRAARGEQLFHPRDGLIPDTTGGKT